MEKWQKFLDSIATKGGNLLLLGSFVMFLLLLVIWILITNHTDAQVVTVILSTFSGFAGALLAALTGQQGGQRKTDTTPNQTGPPNQ
jgi:hypothetical protein